MVSLAAVCFGHLIRHPESLLVDGSRPSIDHANRGRPAADRQRPDLSSSFRITCGSAEANLGVRPLAALGCPRIWRATLGRQSAGGPLLSARLGGLVGTTLSAGLADCRPSDLGWHGGLSCCCDRRSRAVGGDGGRGSVYLASPYSACAHVRGPLSARLGGGLVSLGVLVLRRSQARVACAVG